MKLIGAGILLFTGILAGCIILILGGLEFPTWGHYLFHQQGCRNCLQKIINSYFYICLFGIGHSNHINESCRFFALTVSSTSTNNLNNLS